MTRVATVPALARLKAQFARADVARVILHRGTCGDDAGAGAVAAALNAAMSTVPRTALDSTPGTSTSTGTSTGTGAGDAPLLVESTCDGACWAAPAATVQREGHSHRFAHLDATRLPAELLRCLEGECDDEYAGRGQYGLLERVGRNDGTLADVIGRGAYAALAYAAQLDPMRVSDALSLTDFARVTAASAASTATHLIVDATDAAPGPSRTRHLLEGDPHRLIEGILLACHASGIGSAEVRLPAAAARARGALDEALAQATAHGIVDGSALGQRPVTITVVEPHSPGARSSSADREALVCAVEPLCALTMAFDTPPPPTRLLALSGALPRPGIYEVPLDGNTTWSGVLAAAGVMPGLVPGIDLGAPTQGASARVVQPDDYETPLSVALVGGGDATVLGRDEDVEAVARSLGDGSAVVR